MQVDVNHKGLAVVLPALVGVGCAALSIRGYEAYGWALFLLLPIIVSFLASVLWTFRRKMSFLSCYGVSCLSILATGGFILIFALDGFICLLMALPLALVLALLGTLLGKFVGSSAGPKGGAGLASLLCLCFPLLLSFEHHQGTTPVVREVRTSLLIDAPIEDVWQAVIAFPLIEEEPTGIFRFGIAYPIEASIEGEGVGAIRYCRFNTGDFVEPITVWDAPNKLAFDVVENPAPMKELTIYDDMHAPHLHGFMVSDRGQFELFQEGSQVRIVGTTWYSHSIDPEFYWGVLSDSIIHRIHHRVLGHIKQVVE